ncbi:unnamed protein product, partial [Allacma fusca]
IQMLRLKIDCLKLEMGNLKGEFRNQVEMLISKVDGDFLPNG